MKEQWVRRYKETYYISESGEEREIYELLQLKDLLFTKGLDRYVETVSISDDTSICHVELNKQNFPKSDSEVRQTYGNYTDHYGYYDDDDDDEELKVDILKRIDYAMKRTIGYFERVEDGELDEKLAPATVDLISAIEDRDLARVEKALGEGAQVDFVIPPYNRCFLHEALVEPAIVNALLLYGANPDGVSTDCPYPTPLSWAFSEEALQMVPYGVVVKLIQYGASPEKAGYTKDQLKEWSLQHGIRTPHKLKRRPVAQ